MVFAEPIKSVSYDQGEILKGILKLHVPDGRIDCDMTYGRGLFYQDTGIEQPKFKYDINPKVKDSEVVVCDCRSLPLESESLGCVMFDPPFLVTSKKTASSGRLTDYYGAYPSEKELHSFYIDAMKEAYRVLKKDGILIFKCQDKVSHSGEGRQYMSHVFIHNAAVEIGFYPRDLFVLLAKARINADWQVERQRRARKYHCYFWVFQKRDWRVAYV